MDQFNGIKIDNFTLSESNQSTNALDMRVETSLNNPSVVGVQLGDIVFDMYYGGQKIGQVSSNNVTIHPGPNQMILSGLLSANSTGNNTQIFSDLFTNYLAGNTSSIQVVGHSLTIPNPSSSNTTTPFNITEPTMRTLESSTSSFTTVPWLESAVKNLNLTVALKNPAMTDSDTRPPSLINDIAMDGMFLRFPEVNGSNLPNPILSVKNVTVLFSLPFDIDPKITETRQVMEIWDGSFYVGRIQTAWTPASNAQDPKKILMALPPSDIVVEKNDDSLGHFPQFLTKLFRSEDEGFDVHVTAEVRAKTAVGVVTLRDIQFQKRIDVKGT